MNQAQETIATWVFGAIAAGMLWAVSRVILRLLGDWFTAPAQEHAPLSARPSVQTSEPSETFKLCKGCGEQPRTHPKPELGRIWFDRVPLISWVGRLYGAPAKLTVRIPRLGVEHYCRECQADAVTDLELVIADNIAVLAKVANKQSLHASHVNATLDQRLRKQLEERKQKTVEEFGAAPEPPRPQLVSSSEADTHSLPAMTSGQREGAG